jgi:hypothetical protein
VARLEDTTVMPLASRRSAMGWPSRSTTSRSRSLASVYGRPSAMLVNVFFTGMLSSTENRPASAWRNSSMRTGTFMVLAACMLRSPFTSSRSPVRRSTSATPTSPGAAASIRFRIRCSSSAIPAAPWSRPAASASPACGAGRPLAQPPVRRSRVARMVAAARITVLR